jgi:hypothetical protein
MKRVVAIVAIVAGVVLALALTVFIVNSKLRCETFGGEWIDVVVGYGSNPPPVTATPGGDEYDDPPPPAIREKQCV